MSDRDSSPEEIESRIHATQQDLRHDIDALEEKVSPENLKQQARERMDDATEQLKEKAVDSTRQAGEAVRHRLDDYAGRFQDEGRFPSLSLIGLAAVIGIGLLLVRTSSRGGHDYGHYTRHPDSDYTDHGHGEPMRSSQAYGPGRRY